MKRVVKPWLSLFLIAVLVATLRAQDELDDLGGLGGLDEGPDIAAEQPEAPPERLTIIEQADRAAFQRAHPSGLEAYDEGKQRFQRQDYEGAIESFSNALQVSPAEPMAYYWRGRCNFERKSYAAAVGDFTFAMRATRRVDIPEFLYYRGRTYQKTNRAEEAVEDLRIAAGLNATDPDYHYELGKALIDVARVNVNAPSFVQETQLEARASLTAALDLDENHAGAYYERARLEFDTTEYDTAIEDVATSLGLDGDNLTAVALLAQVLFARGSTEGGFPKADVKTIVSDFRGSAEALTDFLERRKQLGEEELAELDETNPEEDIRLLRAQVLLGLGHEMASAGEDPEQYYRWALEDTQQSLAVAGKLPSLPLRFGKQANAYVSQGTAQRHLNDFRAAEESFSDAIARARDLRTFNQAAFRRGIALFHQKAYQRALNDFGRLTTDPRANFWAGLCHSRLGNLNDAARQYTLALTANGEYVLAYMNRGLAYLRLGKFDLAVDDFDQVLLRDRDNAKAQAYRDLAASRRN